MQFQLSGQGMRLFGAGAVALSVLVMAITPSAAQVASSVRWLYGFCTESNCSDGSNPSGTLLMDSQFNLFGTTTRGGQNDMGTVYEIIQNAVTGSHRHKVIYDFCNSSGCADGALPIDGSLIADVDGNLYGTTSSGGTTGGPNGGGVVFKLTPNAKKTRWTYSVIYHFCQHAGCRDGLTPVGNLTYYGQQAGEPYDKTSPLFGTAAEGGLHNNGVVFSLSPEANGTFQEAAIYPFCADGGSCADGRTPTGGLTMDSNRNVAGTTSYGGIADAGVAFKLVNVGKLRWNETVMHQFCSSDACADGMSPRSGLISDTAGNLYGTTAAGGNANPLCGSSGCGVAFKIDTHGILSQLYAFCALDNCADGGVPARLSFDLTGTPIGLTAVGGAHKGGTLFKLSTAYQDLFDFKCNKKHCILGKTPNGGPVMDTNGFIYGVMNDGGPNQTGGTVIKYTPPQ
jgi:uncharacterized repeat protein (TIGR03803 family)